LVAFEIVMSGELEPAPGRRAICPLPRPVDIYAEILVVKVRVIENIVAFQTEPNTVALAYRNILEDRHVEVPQASGADDVARGAGGKSNSRSNEISGLVDGVIVGISSPHIGSIDL
jgi:hypothetical protein